MWLTYCWLRLLYWCVRLGLGALLVYCVWSVVCVCGCAVCWFVAFVRCCWCGGLPCHGTLLLEVSAVVVLLLLFVFMSG